MAREQKLRHATSVLPKIAMASGLLLFIFIGLLWALRGVEKGGTMETEGSYSKVLLLGLDGMDPVLTRRMMDEGKLPNFKMLSESGSFLPLNTSYPPLSPVAWTSLATGVNPGKHGIFDFIGRDASTYLPYLVVPKLVKLVSGIGGTEYESPVKATPFWRVTSDAGIPTTVLRWPVTFPPESVKGTMLSGLGVPDIRGILSGYTYYREGDAPPAIGGPGPNKAVAVENNEGVIQTQLFGPKMRKAGSLVSLETPIEIRGLKTGDSAELVVGGVSYPLKKGEWSDWVTISFRGGLLKKIQGIFKAYLLSTDPFEMYVGTIQIDPTKPLLDISSPSGYSTELARDIGLFHTLGMPEETAGYVDSVLPEQALLDQVNMVEEERDRMFWKGFQEFVETETGVYAFVYDSSDRLQHVFWDATVLQGDKANIHPVIEEYYIRKDTFLGQVLQQLDNQTLLLIVSDHGFTSFERTVNINTWLVENGLVTLKGELKEGEDGALFSDVDWSKTKAYSVGFTSISINGAGRENEGTVEEREAVVSQVIEGLMNLTDEKYGIHPVYRAYRREEIYSGPYLSDAPDIIVGFSPGYRMDWQSPIGGFTKDVIEDNLKKWKGEHLTDPSFVPGVMFSNVKLEVTSASQVDVAPTVLHALGVSIPPEMDGRSLLR